MLTLVHDLRQHWNFVLQWRVKITLFTKAMQVLSIKLSPHLRSCHGLIRSTESPPPCDLWKWAGETSDFLQSATDCSLCYEHNELSPLHSDSHVYLNNLSRIKELSAYTYAKFSIPKPLFFFFFFFFFSFFFFQF